MTFSKLGTDIQTNAIVELPQASRRQGLYIIGATGAGKSGLIENLILQDIDQGLGVGLLDPHGDLTNAILAKMTKRLDDVILLDITVEEYPFGLNIFECPNPQSPKEVQKIVDLVMHIFEKLYDVSRSTPRIAQYLRNCTYTLVANPGYTMADIPLLLTDEDCRRSLVANVTDPKTRLFWKNYEAMRPTDQREHAESTLNKLDEFLSSLVINIVGQAKTTVKMQQVMDDRKILLVKLSAQLDQVASLIGSVLIALILNAAYSRVTIPINKRKQFNVYADEFQNFATEDFAKILTEARKFGIATTIAHQTRYQPGMTDGIRAVSLQAANFVVFRVTSPDANDLAGSFDTSPPPPQQEKAGTRKKQTPVKNVVKALLDGGGHKSDVVNTFATNTLQVLKISYGDSTIMQRINTLLYKAMTSNNIPQLDFTIEEVQFIANGLGCAFYTISISPWVVLNDGRDYIAARAALSTILQSSGSSYTYRKAVSTLDTMARDTMRQSRIGLLSQDIHRLEFDYNQYCQAISSGAEEFTNISTYPGILVYKHHPPVQDIRAYLDAGGIILPIPEWLQSLKQKNGDVLRPYSLSHRGYQNEMWWSFAYDKINRLQWEQVDDLTYGKVWKIKPGQEWICCDAVALEQAVEQNLQKEKTIFLGFLSDLKQVMQALAANQILGDSGEEIIEYRPGVVRPYQDVKNDIANQLSGLTNYTARVKIGTNAPQNPGKKCLSCGNQNGSGAIYCVGCGTKIIGANEYTITTLAPGQGIGKTAFDQRIASIQARNRDPQYGGYCRARQDVEAEILQRQTSCSGTSPAQPQRPQQQPPQRYARTVPVQQGNCPKCGASNQPGAKFCNQCGNTL